MIQIQLEAQTAVELHHGVGVLRQILAEKGRTEQANAMRDAQLAIAGGLRALGWEPRDGGWAHRPARRRR